MRLERPVRFAVARDRVHGRFLGQMTYQNREAAERKIAPPPVTVVDVVEALKVGFHGVGVVPQEPQKPYEFPVVSSPICAAYAWNRSR